MRVLDVGCGSGDVTLLLSEPVGKASEVVGMDHDDNALTTARGRAAELALPKAPSFYRSSLADMPERLGIFDALVGRRVLVYQYRKAQGWIQQTIAREDADLQIGSSPRHSHQRGLSVEAVRAACVMQTQ